MSRRIEEKFEEVLNATGLGHLPKDSTEIIERKRAFYAGATAMFHELTNMLPAIGTPPEHIMAEISDIALEIENYVAGLELGAE